jgi:hypothetical protein
MRTRTLVLASLGLTTCGWELDVQAVRVLDRTRAFAIQVEVVEFDPKWPSRIGFDPDDAPVVEAMPGDRVRLSALIVGADGHALPSADFDILWFSCAGFCPTLDLPRCDDVEWTTEASCEIGRGGEFEFEVPPLGPNEFRWDAMTTIAVVALDEGIDAERCRQLVTTPGPDLRRCAVIHGGVPIGPHWPVLVDLAEAGVEVWLPITEIPAPALLQPADRLPMPGPPIWVDVDTGLQLVGDPLVVRPGQRLISEGPTWRSADSQPYVQAQGVDLDTFVFIGEQEILVEEWYYTPGLNPVDLDGTVELIVDEDAEPGPLSVVALYSDERWGASIRIVGSTVTDFEVVP